MSIRMTCGIGALALSAVLSLASIALAQTTYYVNGSCGDDSWTGLSPICEAPNGPKATIQAGINAADHFDIVEVAEGIYRGEGNKNIEFFQKEMSIHSASGPTNCIIDCENDGLGFTFCTLPDDRPVTIEGFTIRNGREMFAGGICIGNASVTIDSCIIEHCIGTGLGTSQFGGGILTRNTYPPNRVVIQNTVIRSNTAGSGQWHPGRGGGISALGVFELVIEDCRIEDNTAIAYGGGGDAGGGLYTDPDVLLKMTRCSVLNNRINGDRHVDLASGGGLYVSGTHTGEACVITKTTISGNQINAEVYGYGGGAVLGSNCTLRDCLVADNRALFGGGLYLKGLVNHLGNVTVRDNVAYFDGGGIYDYSSDSIVDELLLVGNTADRDGGGACGPGNSFWTRCVFRDNVAGRNGGGFWGRLACERTRFVSNDAGRDGGGAYAAIEPPFLTNTMITRNRAAGSGGGVFTRSPGAHIYNATIADNAAATGGGGLHVQDAGYQDQFRVSNSVFRDNTPVSISDNSNLIAIVGSNVEGGWPGVGNIDVNPRFFDPNNDDYRLSSGSLCIDAGSNLFVHGESDLAGQSRRVDDRGMPDSGMGINCVVDMGAYEFQGTSEGFIAVHPRPGVAGRDNQLQTAGATPGHVVYFVYGFSSGSTTVPGCPGLTIDIANPRVAAQSTADADGYASKIISIPSAAGGRMVILQAVDHDACTASNAVGYRFP